jgi:hypothetical protein
LAHFDGVPVIGWASVTTTNGGPGVDGEHPGGRRQRLGSLDEVAAAQLLRGPLPAQLLPDLGDPLRAVLGEGDR